MTFMYKIFGGHMLSYLLGVYLEAEFLSHMVNLCLNFWGTVRLLPKGLYHFAFPPAMCEGCNFSISLTTFVLICRFDYNHPSGCEVISHCGFNLHYPDGWFFFNMDVFTRWKCFELYPRWKSDLPTFLYNLLGYFKNSATDTTPRCAEK